MIGRPGYGLDLVELDRAESVDFGDYEVEPFEVSHRIVANGYAIREDAAAGPLRSRGGARARSRAGPGLRRAPGRQPGPGPRRARRARAGDGPDRPGRSIVITGDTEPCEETEIAAEGAELLVHDSSFAAEEAGRAAETGHSTALGAAELAAAAGVGMLALVHISSRHFVPDILDEARTAFEATVAPRDFDLVVIPLPERGGPELVPNGARDAPGTGAGVQEPR